LFKACADKGADLNSTVAWVEELAAIAANPQLRQLADNPKVSDEQVFDLISGGQVGMESMPHFLRVVLETAVWTRCLKWQPSSAASNSAALRMPWFTALPD
jgi:F0F1-type ATP synthase delta subunit